MHPVIGYERQLVATRCIMLPRPNELPDLSLQTPGTYFFILFTDPRISQKFLWVSLTKAAVCATYLLAS